MTKRAAVLLVILGILVAIGLVLHFTPLPKPNTFEVEETEYQPSAPDADDNLSDDKLEDKVLPRFDPALVDRRPLEHNWRLNASAAVIRLDLPPFRPKVDKELLELYPSYKDATQAKPGAVLPSFTCWTARPSSSTMACMPPSIRHTTLASKINWSATLT
jgi:hypothetical protein